MERIDRDGVRRALAVLDDPPSAPHRVSRLDGGYSWRTYRVSGADDRSVILRVAPDGGTLEPYDPAVEAEAIRSAGRVIPVPPVLHVEQDGAVLGAPFSIQGDLAGTSVRLSTAVPPAERAVYRLAFAETLGALHALRAPALRTVEAAYRDELAVSQDHYRRSVFGAHPGFEIGYRWLRAHLPASPVPAAVCHGDFRLANLLWTSPGVVSGVLDWERAWIGDPMADVAFTRLFSGWCAVDDEVVEAYEQVSGIEIDEERVAYGSRFERWRSFTSSMRGLRALVDGRNDDRRLLGIGLAGDTGAWTLVDWLEPGLPELIDGPPLVAAPPVPRAWLQKHRPELSSRLVAAEKAALTASLDALREVAATVAGLQAALGEGGAEEAWGRAFTLLASAARTGGMELLAALKAVSLRTTMAPSLREEAV